MKKQGLFAICLFLFLQSACKPTPSPVVTDTTCPVPCWRNITPGDTTKQELLAALSKMADVDPGTIATHEGPWNIFDDIVYFHLKTGEDAAVYILNDRVAQIGFSGKQNITFEQAVNHFGEPEYILNYPGMGHGFLFTDALHVFIIALRPKNGVMYGYDDYEIPRSWRKEIKPGIKLNWVDFFAPEFYEQLLSAEMLSMGLDKDKTIDRLRPWTGYGDIATKYPFLQDNKNRKETGDINNPKFGEASH